MGKGAVVNGWGRVVVATHSTATPIIDGLPIRHRKSFKHSVGALPRNKANDSARLIPINDCGLGAIFTFERNRLSLENDELNISSISYDDRVSICGPVNARLNCGKIIWDIPCGLSKAHRGEEQEGAGEEELFYKQ
ncbi:MAG: hypothetical protein QGH51_00320 [Planctomycetota bacterium]|nr:hypothetical protein [Planctomycetota bacterium]